VRHEQTGGRLKEGRLKVQKNSKKNIPSVFSLQPAVPSLSVRGPYVGAAYYPDLWEAGEVEKDIRRMLDTGINMVRVGEFAWVFMEPAEGKYELEWLHRVVRSCEEAGIAVVMCTPTAAPPAWLTSRYPETLGTTETGRKVTHGDRRHYCLTSPTYRGFSRRITKTLAREFSGYEGVVAWHLDNEFGCSTHVNVCYCDVCEKSFQQWLEKKYGTIEEMNARWGTGIWSQRYDGFSQVPIPNKTRAWHHPSLWYAFRHFLSDSYADFAREQAGVIRKYSARPITTNGMPAFHRLDYEEMFRDLDFITNDVYHGPKELWLQGFEWDWMRPAKKRPFWVMETSVTWAGGLVPANPFVHDPGSLRAKMWLAYALGGEAVSFWLWRAQWSGQEMEHGSVTYAWGDFTLAEKELRQVVSELKGAAELINRTKPVKPKIAIHYAYQSMWVFDHGAVARDLKYDGAITGYYRMFLDANVPRDLIYPGAAVTGYDVVCSPFLPILPGTLLERMVRFVRRGGTWILGPLSGFRTEDATSHRTGALGPLEKILNLHVRHRFPPDERGAFLDWRRLGRVECKLWCDAFETGKSGRTIATYADGPARGMPAIIERRLGRGKVVVLGTQPDLGILSTWVRKYARLSTGAGIKAVTPGIVATPRVDKKNNLSALIAVDVAGQGGELTLAKHAVNLITGETLHGTLPLKPYDVLLVKFTEA
jgi:beta-galactosidase GanA